MLQICTVYFKNPRLEMHIFKNMQAGRQIRTFLLVKLYCIASDGSAARVSSFESSESICQALIGRLLMWVIQVAVIVDKLGKGVVRSGGVRSG